MMVHDMMIFLTMMLDGIMTIIINERRRWLFDCVDGNWTKITFKYWWTRCSRQNDRHDNMTLSLKMLGEPIQNRKDVTRRYTGRKSKNHIRTKTRKRRTGNGKCFTTEIQQFGKRLQKVWKYHPINEQSIHHFSRMNTLTEHFSMELFTT